MLYGLGQARATFRINLVKGPVLLLVLLTFTWAEGAVGAAWALAAVEAAGPARVDSDLLAYAACSAPPSNQALSLSLQQE